MSIYCTIAITLLALCVTDARRSLYNHNDEPTPEELFGVLGIFPSFCESKVGGTFKKCQTPAPVAVPQMMMGKGKRDARRNAAVSAREDELHEDLADAFNALSSNDKKRLLDAIQNDDVKTVDAIFGGDHQNERKVTRNVGMDDEPTPEDLFGLLGIFPSFCESKVGGTFKKCQTPAPVAVPQMMMGKGKRDARRKAAATPVREDEASKDIADAFNALSSDDKKSLLVAIQHDDVNMVDAIWEGENNSGARTLQRNGRIDNEPTPEALFGKLGIFP